ncbi:hypothetical protein DPV79_27100 [Burkholderia reimsis]|uniref:Uncharacterized protein n=2 Tax=Burkholderia reimsis TaxID=2234132 RepID=A0A365QNL1_9BURK|nr:hypothetical protein DPV79_27100 [Burkholderia reimsis]
MRTFAELRRELAEDGADEFIGGVLDIEYEAAMEAATASGWSGDFHDEPHAFILPSADTMRFGLIWTQPDNELTTFVVSPQPLPWLGEPME